MHEHRLQGQTLRHEHAGGTQEHGYYEHPQDGWKPGRAAVRRQVRAHTSDHMTGLGEFRGVTEQAAVVIREDGSVDAYGQVAVVDQRHAPETAELTELACSGVHAAGEWTDSFSTGADYASYAAERMNAAGGMDDTEAKAHGNVLTLEVHQVPVTRATFECIVEDCTVRGDH
jgi:hypothetical protein